MALHGLLVQFSSLTRAVCLHTRLKMKFLHWLVVVVTYLCIPGFESKCCDSAVCSDLSDKRRMLVGARHHQTQSPGNLQVQIYLMRQRPPSFDYRRHILFSIIFLGQNLQPQILIKMVIYCSFYASSVVNNSDKMCFFPQTGVHSVQVPDALRGPRSQRHAQQ